MSLKNYEIANIETSNSAKQNIPQKQHHKQFYLVFCHFRIYKKQLNSHFDKQTQRLNDKRSKKNIFH